MWQNSIDKKGELIEGVSPDVPLLWKQKEGRGDVSHWLTLSQSELGRAVFPAAIPVVLIKWQIGKPFLSTCDISTRMLNKNPATHPQETAVQVLEKPREHRARSTWVIHWQHRVHLHNQQAGCTLGSHYPLCRLGWTRNILEFWSEAFWNSQQHWSTSAQSMWPSPYSKPRKTELLLRWSRQGRNRRSRFPDPPLLLLPCWGK